MFNSEQLHPGLIVNRENSSTIVSSQATSSTHQVWKTVMQMHCFALSSSSVLNLILSFTFSLNISTTGWVSLSLAPNLLSLSFPPENQLSTPGFDFSVLPPLQQSCPSVQYMLTNPSLQVLPFPYSDYTVLWDVSASSVGPLVPTIQRKQLFSALHGMYHPGVRNLVMAHNWHWVSSMGTNAKIIIFETHPVKSVNFNRKTIPNIVLSMTASANIIIYFYSKIWELWEVVYFLTKPVPFS